MTTMERIEIKATHQLKTWPFYFEEVFMGRKSFEVRVNDRNFKVGDYIILKEWNPDTEKYTGRELARVITFILFGGNFGIDKDHVVMSIQ